MKKRLQGLIAGVLIGATVTGGVVFAATGAKTIEVLYNNIKVYKDNVLCELKDANGTVIEPFIYNGTTYMPVRGTANLAGMDVEWDGATQSVYLWDEMSGGEAFLMDVCPPYDVSNRCREYYANEGEQFSMAGVNYSNGLTMDHVGAFALFNLNSKYSTLEFAIGHTGYELLDKSVSIFVDGKKIKDVILEAECLPKKLSIPISYGLQLKIMTNGNSWHEGCIGIGNIVVK